MGRGLESLIPDKNAEEIPSAEFISSENPASIPVSIPANGPIAEVISTPSLAATSAKTYSDNFVPRRADAVFWIEINKVESNPFQPRREFDPETLKDLAGSIREHGVLQPILVSKREVETPSGLEVKYQLIAGERRWRASQLAGLSQIPAIIRRGVPDDKIKLELALIENVQREDLSALERAKAFKQLIDEFKLVQREVAGRIGKSREMVANTLRLLSLPMDIQNSLQAGQITEGHARAVLMAGDDSLKQYEVFKAILDNRLNVREAENKARQVSGKAVTPRKRAAQIRGPEMKEGQNRLQEKFGTKVQLQRIGDHGKIVVEFYSEEELRALLNKLIQQQQVI